MELYGELNQKLKLSTYAGGETNTATVHIDNETNIITVDAKIDVTKINQQLEETKRNYIATQARLSQLENFVNTTIDGFREDISEFKSEINSAIDEFESVVNSKIEELESNISTLQEVVNTIRDDMDATMEIVDNLNVLAHELSGKIDVINQELSVINEKINDIYSTLENHEGRIHDLEESTTEITEHLRTLDASVRAIDENINDILNRLNSHDSLLESHSSRIGALEQRDDEIEIIIAQELRPLEQDVEQLGNQVALLEIDLNNKYDELWEEINGANDRIDDLEDLVNENHEEFLVKVQEITNDISYINSELSDLKTRQQDLESQDVVLTNKVASVEMQISTVDFKVEGYYRDIQASLTEVDTRIDHINEVIDDWFPRLEAKVDAIHDELTHRIESNLARIIALEDRLDNTQEDISNKYSELNSKIGTNVDLIEALQNALQNLDSRETEHYSELTALSQDVTALTDRVDNIGEVIDEKLIPLEEQVTRIDSRVDNIAEVIDERFTPMEEAMGEVLVEVADMSEKVEHMGEIVDDKLVPLEGRVSDIEDDINEIQTTLDIVAEQVVANTARVAQNTADIAVIRVDTDKIEVIDEKVTELTTDVTALEEAVENIGEIVDEKLVPMDARVTTLETQVSHIGEVVDEKLTPLESRMTQVENALEGKADSLSKQGTDYWYMMSGGASGEVVSGPYDLGSGGGGGSTITEISVQKVDWPTTIAYGAECKIKVLWSSTKSNVPTGNGTVAVSIDGKPVINKKNTPQGEVTLDITDYLNVGTNSVEVVVTDAYSNFDKIIAQLETVAINLTSTFNPDRVFSEVINYTYVPTASVPKTVYFIVDGSEYGRKIVNVSGESQTFPITNLTHGSHTLDVYFTCEVAGVTVQSPTLSYDLMFAIEGNPTPIITSTFRKLNQEQFISFSIPYRVYTPNHNLSNIKLLVNGTELRSLSVDQETQYWEYKSLDYGDLNLSITCEGVIKSWDIEVAESELDVKAVEEDLTLYLTATGRSNSEDHPEIWEDEDRGISCDLQNFNFVSDGWLRDDEGNTILKVTGDARVTIPYKPFERDFRSTGKTIELEFSTDTITNYETELITCYSGDRGFTITPQMARIKSQQSELFTQYKEDEHVRVTFVVEKNSETHLILMYLNGIMSGAYQYPTDDNFRQLTPVNISIGSNEATVNIYCIRVYDNNLNRKQVVNNWIADTQSGNLKAQRYYHNDNYNDLGELVINKLPSDLPYIIWDIDPLPQYKGDKRPGNAVYIDPTDSSRNFTSTDATYNVQGTSSSVYPVKNIRTKYKKNKDWPETSFSWKNDQLEDITSFKITPDGIGDNYFTFKVDYASSEGANNVELVKLYNDAAKSIGVLNPAQKANGKVRVGIDGYPIVAYHQDADGNIKFCTKANFNNDKANEKVYGFVDGDESWEVTNNSAAEGNFKAPATPETFGNAFEIRYPDEDGYSDLSKLGPMTEWVVSTDPEQATNEPLDNPVQYTYTTVIRAEDGTYGNRTIVSPEFTTDSAEYRQTKFKAELSDWFDVNSTIFYYIFTHLYLMVDSRAKNAFPTYFVSRQAGDGGNKWFWLPYDMDTAIGINNEGKLVFDYSLEDVDQVEGANVFNGQNSTLWCNLREMFDGEIGQMYSNLRTSGSLLSFDETENRFEAHQNKWSENIFNEDSYHKYIVPLIDTGDNYLEMLQGSKAEQRKWWLYNRFKYFDSKYLAGEAKSDVLQFRAYAKADVTITPYADIYATVSYANTAGAVVSVRAKRNQSYTLPNPLPASASDQETYIYSASQLKYVGDLSPFKPDTVKAANAIRLQELKVGDGAEGYTNPNLKELSLGRNVLLKKLDVRNCVNLTSAIDIRNCTNIEEVYFDNTRITGLQIPVGGILKKLHLPDTLTNLTIRNQKSLEELVVAGTENVQTLWLENIPSTVIDAQAFIMEMQPGSAVRVIGFNNTFETVEDIEDLYDLLDTMRGINAQGEDVDKAQVSGKIHINTINYDDWARLSARYLDIQIVAEHIICKVTFMNNVRGDEWEVFNIQNIEMGNDAIDPGIPSKESTAQWYYTFDSWDGDFTNVQEDLVINSIYYHTIQTYEVKFNTQSTLAHVDSQFIDYGNRATKPADPVISGVEFMGWYNESYGLNEYDFNTLIEGPTEIFAKWHDVESPIVVEVVRDSFNKFTFTAEDNLGVSAWALVKNSSEEPTEWNEIEPTSPYEHQCVLDSDGVYTIWVRDNADNHNHEKSITAYPINRELETGSFLSVREVVGDELHETVGDFAIETTTLRIIPTIDEHYENLDLVVDGTSVEYPHEMLVGDDIAIQTICNPKTYTIKFNLGRYGVPIDDQYVIYQHFVTKPDGQFVSGHIIEGWYTDNNFINEWNFALNKVTGNMTLYAKWIEYIEPTFVVINVTDPTQEVTVNWYQSTANGVEVMWGDGSDKSKNEIANANVSVSHTYAEAGMYEIRITCRDGFHYVGGGYGKPVVMPAELMTHIEFAFNMPYTSAYCLQHAVNITEVEIPRYMSQIAIGMFYECANMPEINIPDTIDTIGSRAFYNCSGLVGEFSLPDSVRHIGDYAFSGCTNVEAFNLPDSITDIGSGVFNECSSIVSSDLPESITTIPSSLFAKCTSLVYVDFPERVERLNDNVFNGCSNLEKVIFRNKHLDFASGLNFHECFKLKTAGPIGGDYNIEFAWTDEIPDNAFSTGNMGSGLTTVVIPETVTRIGNSAFAFCQNLTSINIPTGLTYLGDDAFFYCEKLQSMPLPEGLLYLGSKAFYRCYKLCTEISNPFNIPSTVEYIGANLLQYNFALRVINIYTMSSTYKADTAYTSWFNQVNPNAVIHIPSAVIDTQAAYGLCWNFRTLTDELPYYADL